MTSRAVNVVTPKYIEASSRKGLQTKMEEMILANGKQYDFYQIYESNGKVIAWYREDIKFTYTKTLKLGESNET